MKSNLYNHTFFISIIAALLLCTNGTAQENDLSNFKMRFDFKTVKQADNSRLLEVTFIALNKEDRKDQPPVYKAEIQFFNIQNDEEILLGSSKTSKEGVAQLILPENQKYNIDGEGYINLRARFNSTDALSEEEEDLMVKDLHLDLNLSVIDSVKTVTLTAFTIDSLGVKTPVNDVYVTTYVKAMLSKKNIDEGIISDGEYTFAMSQSFAGNTKGDLTISSIIDDNDEYGNIIQEKTVHWGTFNKQIKTDENKLWTKAAPIWMYVVLTILLLGVYVNFIYTIVNLFKIKKEGSELEIKKEPYRNT
ncbi:hypothetical protein [Lutibacter sp.]|uniref:hypothetical protein n=1 Tax=Lutibacter sp. TaxID=1925666 RepID=UPI0035672339